MQYNQSSISPKRTSYAQAAQAYPPKVPLTRKSMVVNGNPPNQAGASPIHERLYAEAKQKQMNKFQ